MKIEKIKIKKSSFNVFMLPQLFQPIPCMFSSFHKADEYCCKVS